MLATHQDQLPQSVERKQIEELQRQMSQLPQAPGMTTTHHFHNGMYCRRIEIPAGNLIVSKVHKTEHLFIGCQGELFVAGQGESYVLRSGDIIPSSAGTKRAVAALSDVVCLTIHRTDLQSVDGLEAELMQDDPLSMYDINNQPKTGVLTQDQVDKLEKT